MTNEQRNALVRKDILLQHILGIKQETKQTAIVSRYEFHEALLDADDKSKEPKARKASPSAETKVHAHRKSVLSSPIDTGGVSEASFSQSAPRPTKKTGLSTPEGCTSPLRTTPARQAKSSSRQQTLDDVWMQFPAQRTYRFNGKVLPHGGPAEAAEAATERKRRRVTTKHAPTPFPADQDVINLCDTDDDSP
jgi:hypothetical protein